ncbi:MFS multidrug transporter [Histoplasma capsulatum var. duboisii H88]|uniref:MFS multidrug transporter n=1 Tax=Ajellomyces capsulatus (strain H88) TaxID=544711 RepID=F0U9T3_AJEC8|nr:MFS multidrug transporter [Histoplasma capsulatum var. duboisii H88]QSS48952.1 MFS multidrug transporter [Histoplasma capsulatum var. duboisii H88]
MAEQPSNSQDGNVLVTSPYCTHSPSLKGLIVFIASVAATFSGFATNIYFPVISTIAVGLLVSIDLINYSVTAYLVFQAIIPFIWGTLSDYKGRRIAYLSSFFIFTSACVGLARTSNYPQLMVLRCLQSIGSASTIVVGTGVLGDITTREERGGYMGFFQAGQMLPLALGPILGGVFADTLGWRSIFCFLAIYSGTFIFFLGLLLPETLRSLVGNGSIQARGISKCPLMYFQPQRVAQDSRQDPVQTHPMAIPNTEQSFSFFNPIRILLGLEITFAIIFVSICYALWQMTLTAQSTLLKQTYNLNNTQLGLTYVANGVGCMISTASTGRLLDIDYKRIKGNYTGPAASFPLERARLRTAWLWAGLQIASILIFGWTLDKNAHISIPIISTLVVGWTTTSIQCLVFTFLVDVYPEQAATAAASLNLVRCLLGGGGVAAVFPLIRVMGIGWTFTLLIGILLLGLGCLVVQFVYGSRWRRKIIGRATNNHVDELQRGN